MTIDGTNVQLHSARCFIAIGGGYGVKVRLLKGDREFVMGPVADRHEAESIVGQLNACENGEAWKSEDLCR